MPTKVFETKTAEGAIQYGLFGGHEVVGPITKEARWATLAEYYDYCADRINFQKWDEETAKTVLSEYFREDSDSYREIWGRLRFKVLTKDQEGSII